MAKKTEDKKKDQKKLVKKLIDKAPVLNKINKSIYNKERLDDELDVTSKLITIHDKRANTYATSDTVLAFFDSEKDKQYIIDMVYSCRYAVETMYDHLSNWKIYEQENELGEWEVIELDGKKEKVWIGTQITPEMEIEIHSIIKSVEGLFMDRINMLCVLNRNKSGNELLKMVTNFMNEFEKSEAEENMSKSMKAIKQKLGNEEKKAED